PIMVHPVKILFYRASHTPVVPVGCYWKNNRFYQDLYLVKQLYRATSCRDNVQRYGAWLILLVDILGPLRMLFRGETCCKYDP
ncbi:hypothetical protein, partial [Anaerophaga thermohalophila]|uniref:hypothetical protein n=1 Tax=Anaerophaga thermohalophila TaxID=177400 RepID=UPI001C400973